MNNVVFAVMKKEIIRIFNDKKLLFAAVILPGFLVFAAISLTGLMSDMMTGVDENHVYEVHAVNLPDTIATLLAPQELRLNVMPTTLAETPRIREEIADQNTDILLVFPPNFEADVAIFDPSTATEPAPNVEMWSNSARASSAEAASIVAALINAYHHSLTHRFTFNAPTAEVTDGIFDLATAADLMALLLGLMLPMMFILFIFTGCQSLVPESVAGEKERGTLGTLLVTTASRKQMALGKTLGLAFFSLLSAVGSFVGLMFSVGQMMPGADELIGDVSILEFFSVQDILLLLLISVSLSLLFVALLSVISTYSKSVKEANAVATPMAIVVLIGGMGGGLAGGTDMLLFHLIPIFNSSLGITAIINSEASVLNITVAIVSNLVFAMILTGVMASMFNSEKIVFD
ncbi:MAG: ABC transporter permease [Defluviitaleaceae bacterium]|nr:ABC transporter permease [Defluviitaleaceae bacterium]